MGALPQDCIRLPDNNMNIFGEQMLAVVGHDVDLANSSEVMKKKLPRSTLKRRSS